MSNENKSITRRILEEAFSEGRFDVLDECVAPNHRNHDPAAPPGSDGPQGMRRMISMYRAAFPDLRFTIEDQIADGDKVTTRWVSTGTHRGTFMGKPATNRKARVEGVTIARYQGGKMVENWAYWDFAGLLQQLGLVQMPRMPAADGEQAQAQRR